MTKTNEFYLSKDGKACHIDLKNNNFFFNLGFDAISKGCALLKVITQKAYALHQFYHLKGADRIQEVSMTISNKIGLFNIAGSFIAGAMIINYGSVFHELAPLFIEKIKTPYQFSSSIFESKKEAFANLLMITEGKSNKFYKDNSGIAVGYGWNPTKNPKEFNLEIAKAIGLNYKEQKIIEKISANSKTQQVPVELKKMVLSEKQLKKSVNVMMNAYEKEFLKVLKFKADQNNENYSVLETGYHSLPYNQQAVLLHMTYKVGAKNLLKYNNFFDALFLYIKDPSPLNLKKASEHFEYSYKSRNGDIKRDSKIEKEHEYFFNECLDKKEKVTNQVKSCRSLFTQNKSQPFKNG